MHIMMVECMPNTFHTQANMSCVAAWAIERKLIRIQVRTAHITYIFGSCPPMSDCISMPTGNWQADTSS